MSAGDAGTEVQPREHSSASSIVSGMQGRWGMSQGTGASTGASAKLTGLGGAFDPAKKDLELMVAMFNTSQTFTL